MKPATITAPPQAAGERLDVFLAAALERPRSQVQKLLQSAMVQVNGKTERPSYQIQPGDVVVHQAPPRPAKTGPAPDLKIVYEDKDLVVVDKPAGLAVHPGAASRAAATVADFARHRTTDPDAERPGIVHRLDRDTSGLLIIAKNAAAKAYLQNQFKARQVQKTYQLLVVGRLNPEQAVIKLPLGRNPANPLQQAVVASGREAVTPYRATRYYPGYTLVEAQPKTGRTHQLRVHFAALGHPVAGDTTYGPPRRPLGLKRQFLHATGLEFTTPSGQTLKLRSPLPAELKKLVAGLEAGEAPA